MGGKGVVVGWRLGVWRGDGGGPGGGAVKQTRLLGTTRSFENAQKLNVLIVSFSRHGIAGP